MNLGMSSARCSRPSRWSVLVLACFAACHTAAAQTPGPMQPPSLRQPQAPTQSQQNQPQQRAPIRVSVEVVNTPVVVHDAKGALVLDLERNDFRIYDNGLEQPIEAFDAGGAPLSLVIVAESSSRVEALLPVIRRTGIMFTQSILGENGEAAVIGYNDTITKLTDFTKDYEVVEHTLSDLKEGTSGARLYDSLSQAVRLLRDRPADRRRVIVALAEASDTGSEEKLGDVMREAQTASITIYSVGLSSTMAQMRGPQRGAPVPTITPPGTFGQPAPPGTVQTPSNEAARAGSVDLLGAVIWAIQHATDPIRQNSLELTATATGGLYQAPVRDQSIDNSLDKISGELHGQYVLSYHPAGTEPGYHEIKVTVRRAGTTVRARPGYYGGAP